MISMLRQSNMGRGKNLDKDENKFQGYCVMLIQCIAQLILEFEGARARQSVKRLA